MYFPQLVENPELTGIDYIWRVSQFDTVVCVQNWIIKCV